LSQVKVEPQDFFDAYDCGHENRARQSISIWAATSTSGTDCGQARPNAPSKRAVGAGGVKDSMPLIPGDPRGKLKIRTKTGGVPNEMIDELARRDWRSLRVRLSPEERETGNVQHVSASVDTKATSISPCSGIATGSSAPKD
jgi:hypothetical protein